MLSNDTFLEYRGPVEVTCLYFCLYYGFIILQVVLKFGVWENDKKKNDKMDKSFLRLKYHVSTHDLVILADRTIGNMLEQMIPFLSSLWLHALFLSPDSASLYGMIYVCTRAYYPVMFRFGMTYVFLSTVPNYMCIFALITPVMMKCFNSYT